MKKITVDDLQLDQIGHSVHLVGTLWKDYKNNLTYVVPLTTDLEPSENFNFIEADAFDNIRIINCAWLLEGKRYMGFQSEATRAALKRSQRHVEHAVIWKVFRRDGFACVYCGDDDGPMTYDHYVPASHGGATTVENGRTSCRACNHNKANTTPEEWLQSDKLKKRKEFIVRIQEKKNAKNIHGNRL